MQNKRTVAESILLLECLKLQNRLFMPKKMETFLMPARYKFAYGGRGGGKSESIGKALLYRADREKLRILCTREIQNSIEESVYKMLSDQIASLSYKNYTITNNSIVNDRTGSEFIFKGLWQEAKKQSIKSYANIDICWIEEAQAVSKSSLDLLYPTIRKAGSEIWASFNRTLPEDPIYKSMQLIEPAEKIEVLINFYDNPFLPEELRKQAERSKREYEAEINNDYLHIWEGLPREQGNKCLLKYEEIKAASVREASDEGAIEIGADIARFGDDRTVLIKRKGKRVIEKKAYQKINLVETANRIRELAGYDKKIKLKIDDTGLGGGVTDMLKADFYNVIPVNFGGKAKDKDKYTNVISEMWGNMKSIIKEISIPNDIEIINELASREYSYDNSGRIMIESKQQYKGRGHKSPDLADALLLAFYEPQSGPAFYNMGDLS